MTAHNRCGPDWLHDKLHAGDIVVIDGATGTELETRGVPMNNKAWSGAAVLTHPEVVRAIHADYILAGAEVIITNTFASGRHMLGPAGLTDQAQQINRSAVDRAREARDDVADAPVAIAGSMCEWVAPDGAFAADMARLGEAYREQAAWLTDAGVDLISVEMCSHPVHTPLVIEAAVETGLPVWVGVSCKREPASGNLVGFDPPYTDIEALIAELSQGSIGVVNIMHTAIEDITPSLSVLQCHWSGPFGVYPESGYFTMPNWQFVDIVEPNDLITQAHTWVADGAQIIGGCCGLSVQHIKALKQAFA